MTDTNLNTTPGQPDDGNSHPDRDILDFIDETAAQIADAEIEERLRETLRRAGYSNRPGPCSGADLSAIFTCPDDAEDALGRIDASYKMGSQMLAELAQAELAAARLEMARIRAVARETVEAAREEADKALSEAAELIRGAKLQAEQIVSEAKLQGDKIVADARQAAAEQIAAAERTVGAVPDARRAIAVASAAPTAALQAAQVLLPPPFLPSATGEQGISALFKIVDVPVDLDVACTDDPELFFAEAPEDVEAAKALCLGCRLRAACLEGALERREPWGVWGGELLLRGVIVQGRIPERGSGQPQAVEKDACWVPHATRNQYLR